jgi:molecular chaperone GrpE (heat shock protein)
MNKKDIEIVVNNDETAKLQENFDNLVAENQQILADIDKLTEENNKLTKTVARLQSSADNSDKYRDQLVSLKADFDSYKRRMRDSAEENTQQGVFEAVKKILPIVDTFALARPHLSGENLAAFEMVEKEFCRVLTELGVTKMDTLGADFDVTTMNALSNLDRGEENAGKVVEVYKDGYTFAGKVLRYAEVIIGA